MQQAWVAQVDASAFDNFLGALWDRVRQEHSSLKADLPSGVGGASTCEGLVEYAVHASAKFLALRVFLSSSTATAPLSQVLEAFFLRPASSSARIAFRHTDFSGKGLSFSPLPWLPELENLGAQEMQEIPPSGLPGFTECIALMASNFEISTTSASAQEALEQMRLELDYYRQLASGQSREIRHLRVKLRTAYSSPVVDGTEESDSDEADSEDVARVFDDLGLLPQWARENEHRIAIHPRALSGAKKSKYESPSTIFTALEILAGPYRDQRLGIAPKDSFQKALEQAGIQFSGSAGRSIAGEQGDEYFVMWNGRRTFMDLHLLKGGGREERYCMRVYFFWDSYSRRVVVGSLPAHLSNSLS